jgi:mRNA-degrading endonuclease RelE of RelBE toxin-antitoxin system
MAFRGTGFVIRGTGFVTPFPMFRRHDKTVKKRLEMNERKSATKVCKLPDKEGYRLRMGRYRILYAIDETQKKIEIFSIAHRQEVYRRWPT